MGAASPVAPATVPTPSPPALNQMATKTVKLCDFQPSEFTTLIGQTFGFYTSENEPHKLKRKTRKKDEEKGKEEQREEDEEETEGEGGFDFSKWLPDEVLVLMFSFLSVHDLCALSMVSSTFHACTSDDFLWHQLSKKQWPSLSLLDDADNLSWKENYRRRMLMEKMWMQKSFTGGDVRSICEDGTRTKGNLEHLQYNKHRLVTIRCTSMPKLSCLEVWDVADPEVPNVSLSYPGKINAMQFSGSLCLTASDQGTLDVWDLSAGVLCGCLSLPDANEKKDNSNELNNPSALCLQFDEHGRILLGYSDGSLRMWDLRSGSIVQTYAHYNSVTCLKLDKHQIFSGTSAGTLHLWDMRKQEAKLYENSNTHKSAIQGLAFNSSHWISACSQTTNKWQLDLSNPEDLRSPNAKCLMCINDLIIYSMGGGNIRIDSLIRPKEPVRELRFFDETPRYPWSIKNLPASDVKALQFDFKRIIHTEGTHVRVWTFDNCFQ
jgi:WD40 repeat protein